MKKFKSYTAKKYRIWRRIAFFAAAALIIFGLTVLVGNILKKRLDNTDVSTDDIFTETDSSDTTQPNDSDVSVPHDEALKNVCAGCLDLTAATDGETSRAVIDKLRADGYNAVSFVVRDGGGMVTYASPALQEYAGIKASAELVSFDNLKAAVAYAKDRGMRCSAVFGAADGRLDSILAKELADIGFEDFLSRGYENLTQLDNSAVADIKSYIEAVRGENKAAFGLSLSREIYTTAQNAPYIEKIYTVCEYLSIDMTEITADEARDIGGKLQGSFSMYMMRCVLRGVDSEAAAEVKNALLSENISSMQYISSPPQPNPNDAQTTAADSDKNPA